MSIRTAPVIRGMLRGFILEVIVATLDVSPDVSEHKPQLLGRAFPRATVPIQLRENNVGISLHNLS